MSILIDQTNKKLKQINKTIVSINYSFAFINFPQNIIFLIFQPKTELNQKTTENETK